jgi:small basic protein
MLTDYTPDLAGVLALLVQFVLPLIVGLVTRPSTPGRVQAVLLLALTAVTQFLTEWLDNVRAEDAGAFDWRTVAWNIVLGFVIAVATHYGLWRPTGATSKALAVGARSDYRRAA